MITEIRSGLNVKRFHTTNRIQEETVGHHSANVAAIILRLEPKCSRDLLAAAILHDVAEVFTGDVPATFKWANPQAKFALQAGEDQYNRENNIHIHPLTPGELELLKLADMLDLVLSSLEELNRGNRYARELVVNGQNYIMGLDIYGQYEESIIEMVMEVKVQCQLTTDK